jgi:hypothetical protein
MDTDIGGGQTRDDLMTLRLCDVILCTLKTSFTTLRRSRSSQCRSCDCRARQEPRVQFQLSSEFSTHVEKNAISLFCRRNTVRHS